MSNRHDLVIRYRTSSANANPTGLAGGERLGYRKAFCMLHFDENENSSASDLSWPSTRLESFDVHMGKFSPAEIDRNTTRTIASPQRAFFPGQLGVRKFTYLPDCFELNESRSCDDYMHPVVN